MLEGLGARISAAIYGELASVLGPDLSAQIVRDALGEAAALPIQAERLKAFVEGPLRGTLRRRLGEAVASEALDRVAPLIEAWSRIEKHRRSEPQTSGPRAPAVQWTVILGPERAWALDLLAESLGEAYAIALANEPADLDAIAERAADRVLLLLDRAQRWGGRISYPPHWSAVLAPSRPDERVEEIAQAVRRLARDG